MLGSIHRNLADPNRKIVAVRTVTPHTGYVAYYLGNDMAILTLTEDVVFNDYIRPVCLPDVDEMFPLTSLCYSSGWGLTDFHDGKSHMYASYRFYLSSLTG